MLDFVNKVLTIILAFIFLVLGPVVIIALDTDSKVSIQMLNDMSNFLDRVTDANAVYIEDLEDLKSKLNLYGQVISVDLVVYKPSEFLDVNDVVKTEYIKTKPFGMNLYGNSSITPESGLEGIAAEERNLLLNGHLLFAGDIVKVEVKEVTSTLSKRLLRTILGYQIDSTHLQMAKGVF